MPVALDTPLAGLIDVIGGFSLSIYAKLLKWKQEYALRHPQETVSFKIVAQRC
jgi:hypothetical protein